MNTNEYAWAAGFWDGEGCVSLSYRGKFQYPRSVLQVAQVHREPLERFRDTLGFGNILGPYPHRYPNSQDYYVWRCEGNTHLVRFKELLYDYLCSIKQRQMDAALEARRVFETTSTCPVHTEERLIPGGKGYRCLTCQQEMGRKNANARWNKAQA